MSFEVRPCETTFLNCTNALSANCCMYAFSSGDSGRKLEPAFLKVAPVETMVVSSTPYFSISLLKL